MKRCKSLYRCSWGERSCDKHMIRRYPASLMQDICTTRRNSLIIGHISQMTATSTGEKTLRVKMGVSIRRINVFHICFYRCNRCNLSQVTYSDSHPKRKPAISSLPRRPTGTRSWRGRFRVRRRQLQLWKLPLLKIGLKATASSAG